MFRRTLLFVVLLLMAGAIAALLHLNPDKASFSLGAEWAVELPVGVLVLLSLCAGALAIFVLALIHEGRNALRAWRVNREVRAAAWSLSARSEARSLALSGDYARARALFTKAAKKHEPDPGQVVDMADTWFEEGRPDQARKLLEDGLKDLGNDPLLLFAYARACSLLDDHTAAVSALGRARASYPDSPRVLEMLRDELFAAADWDAAEQVQQRLVRIRPDDDGERNRLLGARFEKAMQNQGELREALLRSITDSDPDFSAALLERARTLATSDHQRQATRLLEKAVLRKPTAILLRELELLTDGDQAGRMPKLYGKLLARYPDEQSLALLAARYYAGHSQADTARELLEKTAVDNDAVKTLWLQIEAGSSASGNAVSSDAGSNGNAAIADGPGPVFACSACSAGSSEWTPRCSCCGRWSSLDTAAT
jgi:thioredoxin-like negative regulator of GroEL